MSLQGKVAIVTGASRGIGAALAHELSKLGVKVACVARSARSAGNVTKRSVEDTADEINAAGREAIGIAADMGSQADVVAMVDETIGHFGRVDILVNNAAIVMNPTDLFSDLDAMDYEMAVNLRGPMIAMRSVAPHMRMTGEGRILSVSSIVALNVLPTMMTYGVSKLALERLTLDVASQLRSDNIACNIFRIDVPTHNSISDDDPMAAAVQDYLEPEITAAHGMIWMLSQPPAFTSRLESMSDLCARGVMPSQSKTPFAPDLLPFPNKTTLRLAW